jgi:hypothetical protein
MRTRNATGRLDRAAAAAVVVVASLTAAIASGGCNCGGGGGDDAGHDAGTSVDNLCAEWARRQCDHAIRCGQGLAGLFPVGGTFTALQQNRPNDVVAESERARCEAFIRSTKACRVLTASLRNGRSVYTAARFDACLASFFPSDTCARDLNQAALDCLDFSFATAATPPGGRCVLDGECAGGYCDGADVGAGQNTCGTCAALQDGGSCTRSAQCDPSAFYCGGGLCVPYRQVGDSCDPTRLDECAPGTVCALTGVAVPLARCAVARQEGESCVRNRYQCARSQFPPELICARVPVDGGAPADVCVKTFAASGGNCNVGETLPQPGFPPTPICLETEHCDTTLGRCVPRVPASGAATATPQCVPGTRHLNGSCVPFSDLDGACSGDADCKNLLTCRGTGGRCATQWLLPGEAGCTTSRPSATAVKPCAEGWCDLGAAAPACVGWKPAGESCAAADECQSDSCGAACAAACWD